MTKKTASWTPTICYMCYTGCGVMTRTESDTVVELAGNEEYPHNWGKLCAKGRAGIMGLYDPYRVKVPLKRTNPEKGLGQDPGWKEIGWEEALETISTKMKRIREEDPRKLVLAGLDFNASLFSITYASAFGTPNFWVGPAGYFCGNVLHPIHYLMEGAFYAEFDLPRCNYCLLVGSQAGFMANLSAVGLSQQMADARERGMKVVVVDPVCSSAGAKASEWIPIRPGTDAALALAMLNLIVNEWNIYDHGFLKNYTNAPYLVSPQGRYVRDEVTGKPLVWNLAKGKGEPYDSPDIGDFALEGKYQVGKINCLPSFQVLKNHVRSYSLEFASRVTTIPATTIAKIAKEFAQAASIGSTIIIEGKELPLRPAAVVWTRGAGAHKHGALAGLALHMLNVVVGAIDVPGGVLGNRTVTPFWEPKEGPDGLLVPGSTGPMGGAYPARKPSVPETMDLAELFPIGGSMDPLFEEAVLNPERFSLPYRPELMIHVNSNFLMTTSSPKRMAQVLGKIPFMVSFSLYDNETTAFADILLPDSHYLERFLPFPNSLSPQGLTVVSAPWYWALQQPVAKTNSSARSWLEVMLELADQAGFLSDFYMTFNSAFRVAEPYRLDPKKKYSFEEMADALSRSWFGPERDLAWFKEHGLLKKEKRVENSYPRPFLKPRIPVYLEYLLEAGQELKGVTDQLGLDWDISDYQPLPDWKPCPAFEESSSDYDLYAVNYKLPFHTFSFTVQNPWLDDLAGRHPFAYKILIHREVATAKGIKDGDTITVKSSQGKVQGIAKVTDCIHHEVVGIAGAFGHWSDGLPRAKGKGVHFNSLLPSGLDRIDMVSGALDSCIKVQIHKTS